MWKKFLKTETLNFVTTKAEIHHSINIIAGFSRSFLSPSEEDENATLRWDSSRNLLKTKFFGPKNNVQLGLNIEKYQLQILVEEMVFDSIFIEGRSAQSIQEWIINKLKGIQIDTINYSEKLPYQIEDMDFNYEHIYVSLSPGDLSYLTSLYQNGQVVLQKIIETENLKIKRINVWPHHFDMAITFTIMNEHVITMGMSPGDSKISIPYFYVSIYPKKSNVDYEEFIPIVGKWNNEGWQGLYLTQNDFILENEYLEERIILDFLRNALQLVKKLAAYH